MKIWLCIGQLMGKRTSPGKKGTMLLKVTEVHKVANAITTSNSHCCRENTVMGKGKLPTPILYICYCNDSSIPELPVVGQQYISRLVLWIAGWQYQLPTANYISYMQERDVPYLCQQLDIVYNNGYPQRKVKHSVSWNFGTHH